MELKTALRQVEQDQDKKKIVSDIESRRQELDSNMQNITELTKNVIGTYSIVLMTHVAWLLSYRVGRRGS